MTRLEAFRKAQKLTYDALGLRLGRTGVQCQRYCKAVSQPRTDVAARISDLTHGLIHAGNYADEMDPAEAADMMAEIARREAAATSDAQAQARRGEATAAAASNPEGCA